jgi:hypothetical protein
MEEAADWEELVSESEKEMVGEFMEDLLHTFGGEEFSQDDHVLEAEMRAIKHS